MRCGSLGLCICRSGRVIRWRARCCGTCQRLGIEAAINRRQFAVTGASRFTGGTMTMPSGRVLRAEDVLKPLGNPKRTPDFYEVALQHTRLVDDGEPNPTARMAELSRVPLSTAQGWVARARRKGLLPPGRRGRAG